MSKRARRATALWLGLVLTLLPAAALAQRIVLLRPRSSDPALLSAFAHLQGELRAHDFEVVLVDSDDATPEALERAAEQESAVAAISLLRSRDIASADIWVSDRVTGKTSRRTITTPPRPEGPSLLAVRAVDLLRASLREYGSAPEPPSDVVGAAPARAPAHVLDWAREKPSASSFVLEAGVAMQTSPSAFSPAYGPAVAVGYDLQRLALRLSFQGPLWGASYATEGASAKLLQEQLMAEVGWRFWSSGALSSTAGVAIGAYHVSVQGEATTPYQPESDSTWTGLASVGLGFAWRLAPAAALSLRARSLALVPEPVVNVGADAVSFGRPLFQIAGGLDASF